MSEIQTKHQTSKRRVKLIVLRDYIEGTDGKVAVDGKLSSWPFPCKLQTLRRAWTRPSCR
jgi:hypothetical protein